MLHSVDEHVCFAHDNLEKNKQYPGKQARNNILQVHNQIILSQHKTHSNPDALIL